MTIPPDAMTAEECEMCGGEGWISDEGYRYGTPRQVPCPACEPQAVTAAAAAISDEYRDLDGNPRERWSRDLAILALKAAAPLIGEQYAAAERDHIRVTPEVMRAADVAYIAAEGKQARRRGLLAALETFADLLRGDRP